MKMGYRPPTLCRFLMSLPHVALMALLGYGKHKEKVLEHGLECKNARCHAHVVFSKILMDAHAGKFIEHSPWVTKQYEMFLMSLNLVNSRSPSSIHYMIQHSTFEEISLLSNSRLFDWQVVHHSFVCKSCHEAYLSSITIEIENMSFEEKLDLDEHVARIRGKLSEVLPLEQKMCMRVGGMTSLDLSDFLKGEDADVLREHAKKCSECSRRISDIEFLESLDTSC